MKKIKVKICRYEPSHTYSYGHFFLDILKKHYEVELSEDPEYLFYNEGDYDHLDYDCIKIFYTGENVCPNFNFCDYALGFDYLTFGDRYYRLPIFLVAQFYRDDELALAGDLDFTKQKLFTKEDLAKKTGFCSFVYANYLAADAREIFFKKLSTYKQVSSGGSYLNNVGGRVPNKLEFEMKHKFSIAFENSSNIGYTTEKLPNALVAGTIPIYWGNPAVNKEFNEKRFINCNSYSSFDKVIERVKEIDKNDELYLQIVNEPVAAEGHDFKAVSTGFEEFLMHIIDQPLEHAKRNKINPVRAASLEKNERIVWGLVKKETARINLLAKIYQPFKKLKFMEKLKQKIRAKKYTKND